ncbi:hypothetical protein [Nitrosococcus wardiae]|uniref:hypothetical protein n=1 Tax=Nitrosococcus wardiae TaxID=1814290 RepID=UPI001F0FD43C|nr:hypothetical protein [Nitrosococcus wardiae]
MSVFPALFDNFSALITTLCQTPKFVSVRFGFEEKYSNNEKQANNQDKNNKNNKHAIIIFGGRVVRLRLGGSLGAGQPG